MTNMERLIHLPQAIGKACQSLSSMLSKGIVDLSNISICSDNPTTFFIIEHGKMMKILLDHMDKNPTSNIIATLGKILKYERK